MAQRCVGGGEHRFMHHTQLAAQLGHGAGGVDGTQHALPEATAHGKDGVVGCEQTFIVSDVL